MGVIGAPALALIQGVVRHVSEKGDAGHDGPVRDSVRPTSDLSTACVRAASERVRAATQPDPGQTPPVYDRGLSGECPKSEPSASERTVPGGLR